MGNIICKIKGICKLVIANEWFLITDMTVNASYKEKDHSSLIRTFAETVEKSNKIANQKKEGE